MTAGFEPDVTGPAIYADEASEPFFEAAARGVLLLRRCPRCGEFAAPTSPTCGNCSAPATDWAPASGAATLVTWAVVRNAPHPALADQVPYVSALVELAEGPWLPLRLVENADDPSELVPGMPLDIVFAHPAEGAAYPLCTVPRS